jgi:hypothetical protein
MDHQAFAQLLGNYGEFVGAIAVVATLFYLARQVHHSKESVDANTQALEESRKIQMAATYQDRVQNMSANARMMSSSADLSEIVFKVLEAGWPSLGALDQLDGVEKHRFRHWIQLQFLNIENLHYQYELGLLDTRFYESVVSERIKIMGPAWKEFGFVGTLGRPSFHEEIERVLRGR